MNKNYIIIILSVLLVIIFFYKREKEVLIQKEFVEVPTIKEVEKIQKVEVPIEKIKVIPKDKIKKEYIPVEVVKNQDKEVLNVVKVPCPEKGNTIVTAVIDKNKKEVDVYSKFESKKFELFYGNEFYVGNFIGVDINGNKDYMYNSGIRFGIIRYKDIYFNINVNVSHIDRSYLGLGGEIIFKF